MLFLPDDSPLRNLPTSTEPTQLMAFDGLRYIFDMLAIAYHRLLEDLNVLGLARGGTPPDKEIVASAFLNTWSLVDNLFRLYQLLHDVPGLKRNTPPLQIYLRALSEIKELRNGIQHLDERLSSCGSNSIPLLGSLQWFFTPGAPEEGGVAMTLISGSVRSNFHEALNPLGKSYFIPLGLITLTAFGHSVNLSDLMDRTRKMALDFDQSLKYAVGSGTLGGADMLISLEMAFVSFPPEHQPSNVVG